MPASISLQQYSASLTRRFDTIVVEDLAIVNMTRSAKETLDEPGIRVAQHPWPQDHESGDRGSLAANVVKSRQVQPD